MRATATSLSQVQFRSGTESGDDLLVRVWDGQDWTDSVIDDGVQSYDPI